MLINTIHFGEIEVDESNVIHFEDGLPGFEDVKKFVLLDTLEPDDTFKVLQAVEQPHPAFAVVNPFDVKSDYEVTIDDSTRISLGISDSNDVAICSVVSIPEKITRMTANLMAPIVINTVTKMGRQMIMNNSGYTTKHYILDEVLTSGLKSNKTEE